MTLRVSVSLRSIIHSYENNKIHLLINTVNKFPSPYGVSFILIFILSFHRTSMFLFCFRLLTEYHSFLFYNTCEVCEPAEGAMVSVSLRSIIHSYSFIIIYYTILFLLCFRLLTEYHSFLFRMFDNTILIEAINEFPSPYGVSFILIKNRE